jgi:hypothetical protein
VYSPSGQKIGQAYYDGQALSPAALTFVSNWTVPTNAAKGTYTVKVGIFKTGWTGMYTWIDSAAKFSVN